MCTPVTLSGIHAMAQGELFLAARAGDPQGETLSGSLEFMPIDAGIFVLQDMSDSYDCGLAYLPDGVTFDGSGSVDPDSSPGTDDDIASFEWFESCGLPAQTLLGTGRRLTATLPLGSHSVSLLVTDTLGLSDTTGIVVRVVDTTAPSLELMLSPTVLWPPNRKMVPVRATWRALDACDPAAAVRLASATSSEPAGPGFFQELPAGADGTTVLLRAERSSSGPGRVYTLTWTAKDSAGNEASAVRLVSVPRKK